MFVTKTLYCLPVLTNGLWKPQFIRLFWMVKVPNHKSYDLFIRIDEAVNSLVEHVISYCLATSINSIHKIFYFILTGIIRRPVQVR